MKQSDLKRISDHFRRSIHTYDDGARVQKEVGDHLVSLIREYPDISFERVLEIGCCTGSMTESICRAYSLGELWVNDLVPECCEHTVGRVRDLVATIHSAPGNVESLVIPPHLDLVVSSSTFQWLDELSSCFTRIAEALQEGGFLVFSMFGPGTMYQVKELTGVGLCYTSENALIEMLQRDFAVLNCTSSRYRIFFPTPREVLRHIQQTGVGGVGSFRWTPGKLKKFEKEYAERFGEDQGMPLDYVSIFAVAKKLLG